MNASTLWTDAELAAVLRVSVRTLSRRVRESETADIDCPAVLVGPSSRRWPRDLGRISDWLSEVATWRASRSAATGTPSGGSTATDTEADSAPTTRRRGRSSARSSGPTPSGGPGSLLNLARSLTSAQ